MAIDCAIIVCLILGATPWDSVWLIGLALSVWRQEGLVAFKMIIQFEITNF